MNYQNLAILVTNSDEWNRAVTFLSKKNGNCRIETYDGQYPKYVFWRSMCIDAASNTWRPLDNYNKQNFNDVEEFNPYFHLIKAQKQGKIIQIHSKVLGWSDIKDPEFEGSPDRYRIKVAHQHLLDAMAEGKIIQYKYPVIRNGIDVALWYDISNPTFSNYELQKDWYRIKPNPYQIFWDAFQAGKKVEFGSHTDKEWFDVAHDSYFAGEMRNGEVKGYSPADFRVVPTPTDPYKIFKDALKEGKIVEYKSHISGKWEIRYKYEWSLLPTEYRIQPEPPKNSSLIRYRVSFETIRDKNPIDMLAEIQKLGPIIGWTIDAKPL